MQTKCISSASLNRLPVYLSYLNTLPEKHTSISATTIAKNLGFGEVQVRKDLSAVCSKGRPKIGYDVSELKSSLENYLEFNRIDCAVIVGAGKLGKALLDYDGFEECGLDILAAFDNDANIIGKNERNKPIRNISEIQNFCYEKNIKIGIIAVPAEYAQQVCDTMIESGITAIMNFAPVHLTADKGITIKNENIAASLALLSKSLA